MVIMWFYQRSRYQSYCQCINHVKAIWWLQVYGSINTFHVNDLGRRSEPAKVLMSQHSRSHIRDKNDPPKFPEQNHPSATLPARLVLIEHLSIVLNLEEMNNLNLYHGNYS